MTRRIITSNNFFQNHFLQNINHLAPPPPEKKKKKQNNRGALGISTGGFRVVSLRRFFSRGAAMWMVNAHKVPFRRRLDGRFGDSEMVALGKVRCLWVSQMLNVWPIYLHLGSFGGKCRKIYHTLSIWVYLLLAGSAPRTNR